MSTEDQSKIYVLRNLSFWYDDEYYSTLLNASDHIGHMSAIFDNKESAVKEWIRLEYEFTHRAGFENFLYEGNMYQLEQLGYEDWCDIRLRKLDPDELFDVIHKTDCHVYALCEYPKNLKQYVVWNNDENQYYTCDLNTDYDFRNNLSVDSYFLKDDPLIENILPLYANSVGVDKTIVLKGALSALTDTPLLLSSLIQQDSDLEYDEQCQELKINPNPNTLNSLNALLKKPLCPKSVTIEEIFQIEKQLNQSETTKEISIEQY